MGTQNGVTAMENSMKFLKKLKIELPYDQAIPLLNIYPKELKVRSETNICKPMFIESHKGILFRLKK